MDYSQNDTPLPDEEDIYGVNDIEEQDRFNALLGEVSKTQDERLRKRRLARILVALSILAVSLLCLLFTCRNIFSL